VRELFEQSRGNHNLRAFAYGYLSHYVTDVVGHPFVNQVVGAPWRMYWQRHHLVENFIDAYVWPRWHKSRPEPQVPGVGEQPLDYVLKTPNSDPSDGAPFTFARLNDHINIGYPVGHDPVDDLILDICDRIQKGLENIGIAEPEPSPPEDPEFLQWTRMMADAFRAAYPPSAEPPENLKGSGRPDGYPTAEDIASAYSVLRLYLRISTEEKIKEPEFPDILMDVWNAITKRLDDLKNSLGAIPPMPVPGIDPAAGGLTLEDLWGAVKNWVKWVAGVAEQVGKAAFQFIKDAIADAGVLLVDSIKAGLYFVKKALFDIYSAFRHFLVRAAYAIPFTDQLYDNLGGNIPASSVWITPGDLPTFTFPMEELPRPERKRVQSNYPPWVPPALLSEMPPRKLFEEPRTWVAPYAGNQTPEAFIDTPLGSRPMLSQKDGPMPFSQLPVPGTVFPTPADFGGAMENCIHAFRAIKVADAGGNIAHDFFPDYNLDGDRGYAWPCWDVARPPHHAPFDHLDPTSWPCGSATVNPVKIV